MFIRTRAYVISPKALVIFGLAHPSVRMATDASSGSPSPAGRPLVIWLPVLLAVLARTAILQNTSGPVTSGDIPPQGFEPCSTHRLVRCPGGIVIEVVSGCVVVDGP